MKRIEEYKFISEDFESILVGTALFNSVKRQDIAAMLMCLNASYFKYEKNEMIINCLDQVNKIGVVLKGRVSIFEEDINGNLILFKTVSSGEIFNESFVCARDNYFPLSVQSDEESIIIFLDGEKIFAEDNFCKFQNVLIKNLLNIIARENVFNNRRISNTMHKTTREKLLAYLYDEKLRSGSNEFVIGYNRQQLADYLGVERSALSVVISDLVKEKIIENNRSWFRLMK